MVQNVGVVGPFSGSAKPGVFLMVKPPAPSRRFGRAEIVNLLTRSTLNSFRKRPVSSGSRARQNLLR
jgi:hypothetical protein